MAKMGSTDLFQVLAKGVAYDSSADWFSLGCMLYKLLRG